MFEIQFFKMVHFEFTYFAKTSSLGFQSLKKLFYGFCLSFFVPAPTRVDQFLSSWVVTKFVLDYQIFFPPYLNSKLESTCGKTNSQIFKNDYIDFDQI